MTHSGSQKTEMRRGLTLLELLVILTIIVALMSLILPARRESRESHRLHGCKNHLKQIALALLEYQDDHGTFPPAYTVDLNGNRLHSWRTLILPYLDQSNLYKEIDLSQAWDAPVNAVASSKIPKAYQCPNLIDTAPQTNYLAICGTGGCFHGTTPRRMEEIRDKHEETLLVIEVRRDQAVHWMKPTDADEKMLLEFDAKAEWPHPSDRQGAFVDASVKRVGSETPLADLKRMMTIAGGD